MSETSDDVSEVNQDVRRSVNYTRNMGKIKNINYYAVSACFIINFAKN